jgi:hypothetical protein
LEGDNDAEPSVIPQDQRLEDWAVGEFEHPIYGMLSILFKGGRYVLRYNCREWPLVWKAKDAAEIVVSAFGIQIPLPVQFEVVGGTAQRVSIPFSMDPRAAGTQVFNRCPR